MHRRLLVGAVVSMAALALVGLVGGCHDQQTTQTIAVEPIVVESVYRYRKEYLIAPGDALDVIVRGHPEITRLSGDGNPGVVVRPDGYITLPLVDDVMAAGKTFGQLDEELTSRFSARLVDPEVTVIGTFLRQPQVYVVGEVATPRAVPLRDARSAAQAIALAGGFRDTGEQREIGLIRLAESGRLRAYLIPVDYEGQPAPYMALQATPLQADDIIIVPERDISQVGRWIDDYINKPLSGVNSVLGPVTNSFLISDIIDN